MSDITKCVNKKCPKKEYCERWTAPEGHWQSKAYYEADGCEMYVPIDDVYGNKK